jgi:hypothetical protein
MSNSNIIFVGDYIRDWDGAVIRVIDIDCWDLERDADRNAGVGTMSTAEQSGWQTVPKLCKDCKHCVTPFHHWDGATCRHPNNDAWGINLVDGSVTVNLHIESGWKAYANNNRDYGICGREGKYFEQKPKKEGIFTRLKRWL